MRFGEKGKKRIKITGVTFFNVEDQMIFFNVLTENGDRKNFSEDLSIHLEKSLVSGRKILPNELTKRRFSLRVNNYLPEDKLLEVKIFTARYPMEICMDAIFQLPFEF